MWQAQKNMLILGEHRFSTKLSTVVIISANLSTELHQPSSSSDVKLRKICSCWASTASSKWKQRRRTHKNVAFPRGPQEKS